MGKTTQATKQWKQQATFLQGRCETLELKLDVRDEDAERMLAKINEVTDDNRKLFEEKQLCAEKHALQDKVEHLQKKLTKEQERTSNLVKQMRALRRTLTSQITQLLNGMFPDSEKSPWEDAAKGWTRVMKYAWKDSDEAIATPQVEGED
jgi:predicted nuclease with TOPRIM domain